MSQSDVLTIIASAIALFISLYLFWRRGEFNNYEDAFHAIEKGFSLAEELKAVGLMAVTAVEQLKLTGKINTNEEAFNEAFDYISRWPNMDKLDRVVIAKAVEGSYLFYKERVKSGRDSSVYRP